MSAHKAVARREGTWWVVTVEDVGVTQGRNLAEAESMAADLVAAVTAEAAADVAVEMTVDLADDLAVQLQRARELTSEAARLQVSAADQTRRTVRELRQKAGISGRDVAKMLGVSEQRISQLVNAVQDHTDQ